MALKTIDNDTLLESLFEIFRCHGYEGATISLLSEATGLKKSSLYHRFPAGKDDMVMAVVNFISAQMHQLVIAPLSMPQDTPEKRFSNMAVTLKALYCDGKKNCLLNVLSLGEVKDEIKAILNKDYEAWYEALYKLGQEAGLKEEGAKARAEHFLISVQGALVIQRLTDNPQTFENCLTYEQERFFHIS